MIGRFGCWIGPRTAGPTSGDYHRDHRSRHEQWRCQNLRFSRNGKPKSRKSWSAQHHYRSRHYRAQVQLGHSQETRQLRSQNLFEVNAMRNHHKLFVKCCY